MYRQHYLCRFFEDPMSSAKTRQLLLQSQEYSNPHWLHQWFLRVHQRHHQFGDGWLEDGVEWAIWQALQGSDYEVQGHVNRCLEIISNRSLGTWSHGHTKGYIFCRTGAKKLLQNPVLYESWEKEGTVDLIDWCGELVAQVVVTSSGTRAVPQQGCSGWPQAVVRL